MTLEEFQIKLREHSELCIEYTEKHHNLNEEQTKHFLIIPFIELLGYKFRPDEVVPEEKSDFVKKHRNKVDYVIYKDGKPVIAIEAKPVGKISDDHIGQLRGYYTATETIKLGILTDGIIYHCFTDTIHRNLMDETAFFTFDLCKLAKGYSKEDMEAIYALAKRNFIPGQGRQQAKEKILTARYAKILEAWADDPDEKFVEVMSYQAAQEIALVADKKIDDPIIKEFMEMIDHEKLIAKAFQRFIKESSQGNANNIPSSNIAYNNNNNITQKNISTGGTTMDPIECPIEIKPLFEALKDSIFSLGSSIQLLQRKDYLVFQGKNIFAKIRLQPKEVQLWLNIEPDSPRLKELQGIEMRLGCKSVMATKGTVFCIRQINDVNKINDLVKERYLIKT